MTKQELKDNIRDFEKLRMQLLNVSSQKQQLEFQKKITENALKELEKNKEEKVFKAVGNILFLKPASEVKAELKEESELVNLRFNSLKKQEDSLINKLNNLKQLIEKETSKQKQ